MERHVVVGRKLRCSFRLWFGLRLSAAVVSTGAVRVDRADIHEGVAVLAQGLVAILAEGSLCQRPVLEALFAEDEW